MKISEPLKPLFDQYCGRHCRFPKLENVFYLLGQTKLLMVPLWIVHVHLYLDGYLKLHLQFHKNNIVEKVTKYFYESLGKLILLLLQKIWCLVTQCIKWSKKTLSPLFLQTPCIYISIHLSILIGKLALSAWRSLYTIYPYNSSMLSKPGRQGWIGPPMHVFTDRTTRLDCSSYACIYW